MSKQISWGILSTANIGIKHVIPAILEAPQCRILAVASRNPAQARSVADRFGIEKAYGSYEELLADPAIDAIYNPFRTALLLDAAARGLITEAGYGAYFNHRLGHFIGQTDHEKGDVSSANTAVARPGMIFSIEPGVYLPGEFGIRVEDLVLVTETGCEVLNRNDKHWDVVGK